MNVLDPICRWAATAALLAALIPAPPAQAQNPKGGEAEDPAAMKAQLIAEYRKIIDVYRAASNFMIDDVIDPRETRPVVIKALEMAENKQVDRPWKKQGVVPV